MKVWVKTICSVPNRPIKLTNCHRHSLTSRGLNCPQFAGETFQKPLGKVIWKIFDVGIWIFDSVCRSTGGYFHIDSDAMEIANVPTLYQRRVNLCKEYFNRFKNKEHKLSHLLVACVQVPYPLRDEAPPVLPKIKPQRYFNSLVPRGVRNCIYYVFF